MEEQTKETLMTFVDKLAEAGTIVTDKLIEVAPDVAQSLLMLIQFKGIFDIILNIIAFLVFSTITAIVFNFRKKVYELTEDSYEKEAPRFFYWLVFFILPTISIILFFNIFNFYNWVAAFYPEGAVAIKALEAVGITL